jgi:phosphoserine phosphatase
MPAAKLICFDCDSTLTAIEGIDELARLRGPRVLEQVAMMTNDAMEGRIPIERVFARRLEIIRPGRAEIEAVAAQYIATVEPHAAAVIARLRSDGWTAVVLSAGYTQAIEPLARFLGIDRVEAVALRFDDRGEYAGFDESFPTTRNGCKPALIRDLKRELASSKTVMVGDGISDLETRPEVDLFVGFGRYVERPAVRAGAPAYIRTLAALPAILR